jgi:hypothetical protein
MKNGTTQMIRQMLVIAIGFEMKYGQIMSDNPAARCGIRPAFLPYRNNPVPTAPKSSDNIRFVESISTRHRPAAAKKWQPPEMYRRGWMHT